MNISILLFFDALQGEISLKGQKIYFDDVIGVQVLKHIRSVKKDGISKERDDAYYYSRSGTRLHLPFQRYYQVVLVLKDGRRLLIDEDVNMRDIRKKGREVARILGRPLWDRTIGEITDDLIPNTEEVEGIKLPISLLNVSWEFLWLPRFVNKGPDKIGICGFDEKPGGDVASFFIGCAVMFSIFSLMFLFYNSWKYFIIFTVLTFGCFGVGYGIRAFVEKEVCKEPPIEIDLSKKVLSMEGGRRKFSIPFNEICCLQLLCRVLDTCKYCQVNVVTKDSKRHHLFGISFGFTSRGSRRNISKNIKELAVFTREVARLLGDVPVVDQVEKVYIDTELV